MAYSQEQIDTLFDLICERVSNGESISEILRNDDMPVRTTFYKWLVSSKEKMDKYARASELRAEYLFDEIFKIADDKQNDFTTLEDGTRVINHDAINRNRLQVDTRKWALCHMNPKKYGEKKDITSGGEKIQNTNIIVQSQELKEGIETELDKLKKDAS
jgi:hypothetical protein